MLAREVFAMRWKCWLGLLLFAACVAPAGAELCITQSQMQPAEREGLAGAAIALAQHIQANDSAAVKAQTMPQYARDFSGMASTIATVAPQLQGAAFEPDTLWILDASAPGAGGATQTSNGGASATGSASARAVDAQFFCNLNKSRAETSFAIAGLPVGRYGLAIVNAVHGATPWQLALLMKESGGGWQLAGLFPRATTASGHDGLWYWKQARAEAAKKESWSAWIDYVEAEQLLKPVNFIGSTHLDQLREEQTKAAPAALSAGVSAEAPLVIKAKDGTEYQVVGLGPDSSLGGDRIDVAMHYRAEAVNDPLAARARNLKAAAALVSAYPELRARFHGVWVFAESGSAPFGSEEPMARLQ